MSEMQTQGGCAVGRQVTVPPISTNTLRFCIAKLTSTDASVSPDEELHFASADQVVEFARNRGWGATFIQSGWSGIRSSLIHGPALLLVLKNGNVIVALANRADLELEEIVVSDPLYSDGAEFFLPRKALEAAWDGVVLAVKPPMSPKRLTPALAKLASGVTLAALVLCPVEASKNPPTPSLFTPRPAAEITSVLTEKLGVREESMQSASGDALLVLTEALNPIRDQEMGASDQESGNTQQPAAIDATEMRPELNPAFITAVASAAALATARRQDVTILRGRPNTALDHSARRRGARGGD